MGQRHRLRGLPPNLFFLPQRQYRSATRAASSAAAQVGYNFQFNQFLIGAETDFQGTSLSGGGRQLPSDALSSPPIRVRTAA